MRKRPDIPLLSDWLNQSFSADDSTRIGVAFGHVARYFTFLHYIFEEYEQASSDYLENTKAITAIFQNGLGGNSFTEKQSAIFDEAPVLHDLLHLRIETFYLFAKIFLDKIAHFFEFYFGQARGLVSRFSRSACKEFPRFLRVKGVSVISGFSKCCKRSKDKNLRSS
jgi:hypothetical protein